MINYYNEPYFIECGNKKNAEKFFNQYKIYPGVLTGTAVVDEDYLTKRFKNENGELEVLAGNLVSIKDFHVDK